MLQPIQLGLILVLLLDRGFSFRREFAHPFPRGEIKWAVAILAAAVIAAVLFVDLTRPQDLFSMPSQRPRLC